MHFTAAVLAPSASIPVRSLLADWPSLVAKPSTTEASGGAGLPVCLQKAAVPQVTCGAVTITVRASLFLALPC